jgi:single-stranded-DNA-specific exonuclease
VPPAVERSVSGRRWRWRGHDPAAALAICQRLELPEVVGRVLAGRGVALDGASAFMAPKLRDLLPDPSHLLDLEVAVERLADAVQAGERIGLLGDYDVDGATSIAVLARYLAAVGAETAIDVPDRLREGYGPNAAALARLAGQGCRLVVTLDSGTTAFEPLATAAAQGLEVIVVDHHVAQAELPPAVGVINPNRRDQRSPIGDLAAVGVTFLLAVALNRTLRGRGHFARRPEPDLRRWLDLVALGTICDVVPLTGLNRALVAQGLKVAARGGNPGLAALARAARLTWPPSAEHCAFALGPRLNAGGRTGCSHLAAELLTSDAPDLVAGIASRLEQLNEERRRLERQLVAAAEAQVAPALERDAALLLAVGEGWSPGVLGLVASRLVERHHRPAVVVGVADGIGKGSARSVAGFDLGSAVIAARQAGLLLQGGGHPMAAGLTIEASRLPALEAFLAERIAGVSGLGRPAPPDLALDGALQIAGLSFELAQRLATVAPFGRGNPEPRFMLPHVHSAQVREVGGAHVGCCLYDPAGGRVRAIAFRSSDQPLGRALMQAAGAPLHLAGTLKLDWWEGQPRVSFHIEDAANA